MWPFRRSTRERGTHPTSRGLTCSFCGKSQDDVRKLIAGPGVHICDECVDLCNDILTEETRWDASGAEASARLLRSAAASTPARDLGLACALCRLPQSAMTLVAVPDRGYLCRVCVSAIRAVTDDEESPAG